MEIIIHDEGDWPGGFEEYYRLLAKSDLAWDACVGSMMLDLMAALRCDVIGPRLFATNSYRELSLQYYAPNGASNLITIKIDRPDYAPFDNIFSRFHYRLSSRLTSSDGSIELMPQETRAHSIETACEFMRDAIARTRQSW